MARGLEGLASKPSHMNTELTKLSEILRSEKVTSIVGIPIHTAACESHGTTEDTRIKRCC